MLGSILIFWAGLSLVIAILYTIALFVVIKFHYEKLKEKIKRKNNGVPVDINLYRLVGSVILMLFTWPFIIYSMIQDRRST